MKFLHHPTVPVPIAREDNPRALLGAGDNFIDKPCPSIARNYYG